MDKKTSALRIALCFCLILPLAGLAAGDAERGAVLADTCLGCHGIPGYRNAYPSFRVPMLGGQTEEYLLLALQGYKSDMREHPTMQAQAQSLSEQDLKDLAAYFGSAGQIEATEPVTSGRAARGAEKIVVCTACHGQTGISPAPNWPNLAGQHKDYLVHSLAAYRDGGRKDAVMMGQAMSLTDADIADIAAYYAAQDGLFTADYVN
ncbi:MAG: c-type cytochrome [Gammaproteobacteria bacterium]|nr:c-type cytochrome [Gammaproteobacteria bacterium]